MHVAHRVMVVIFFLLFACCILPQSSNIYCFLYMWDIKSSRLCNGFLNNFFYLINAHAEQEEHRKEKSWFYELCGRVLLVIKVKWVFIFSLRLEGLDDYFTSPRCCSMLHLFCNSGEFLLQQFLIICCSHLVRFL